MDFAAPPTLCCIAAGAIAAVGIIVGLVLAALVSRRSAILACIWSCLPAAGLAIGAWAWWPVTVIIERVAGEGVLQGSGDRLFGLLYLGSPVGGTIAGIGAAVLVARWYETRYPASDAAGPDEWQPPDPSDVARIVGGP